MEQIPHHAHRCAARARRGRDATAQSLSAMAADLRRKGARRVETEIISGSGHYVGDDEPAQLGALIVKYASR
jgi:hypothetical protein